MALCFPGTASALCKCRWRAGARMPEIKEDLPDPDTPVTVVRSRGGRPHRCSEVVVGGALDAQTVASLRFRALFWNLNASPAGEVIAGHRAFRGHDLLGWTVGHDGPALKASSRAEVAQPIGLTERVFVVFNHHQGVAEVGQFPQGFEQALFVALMLSAGGLVELVHHTRQERNFLCGKTTPLAFAA